MNPRLQRQADEAAAARAAALARAAQQQAADGDNVVPLHQRRQGDGFPPVEDSLSPGAQKLALFLAGFAVGCILAMVLA